MEVVHVHASAAFLAKVKQKCGHIQGTHKMLGGTSVVALRGAYKSNQPLSCHATHKNALGEPEPHRAKADCRVADTLGDDNTILLENFVGYKAAPMLNKHKPIDIKKQCYWSKSADNFKIIFR